MRKKGRLAQKMVGILLSIVAASVVISGCKASSEKKEDKAISSEKNMTLEEFIERENSLCDVVLGFYFDKSMFSNKGNEKNNILLDGEKIATNDISKNLSFVGYMKEGKHEITIESGKSGKSSVEFNVSRTGANVYTYALKHTKTKVDITATNYNYFSFPSNVNGFIQLGDYLQTRNDLIITSNYTDDDLQLGNLRLHIPYCPDMEDVENGLYGMYDDFFDIGEVWFIIRDNIPDYLSEKNAEEGLKKLVEEGLLDEGYDEVTDVKTFSIDGYPAASGKYITNWIYDAQVGDYLKEVCGKTTSTVYILTVYCKGQLYVLAEDITVMSPMAQDLIFQEILHSCEIVETDDYETNQTKASLNPTEESTEVISEMEETEGAFGGEDTKPETIEETASSDAGDQTFIFPDSDTAYITDHELSGLSQDELRYAVNEIYARHHRRFKDSQLQAYFDSKSWYTGTVEPDDFDENTLNVYEKENVKVIRAYIEKIK